MLKVVPITITDAKRHIERHHSHHHAPVGGRVEVRTSRGWEPRRVIQTGRWRYYTRTVGGVR